MGPGVGVGGTGVAVGTGVGVGGIGVAVGSGVGVEGTQNGTGVVRTYVRNPNPPATPTPLSASTRPRREAAGGGGGGGITGGGVTPWRTGYVAVAGGTAMGDGVTTVAGVPHSPQNRSPACSAFPHFAHFMSEPISTRAVMVATR